MKHQKNKTPPPAQADKPVAPQSSSPKNKKRNASKPKPITVKQQDKQGNSNVAQHNKVPHVPHAASAPAVVHAAPSTPPRGLDGVRYAGPTFHNSPAAAALPKPTFGRSPPRSQTQPPPPQHGHGHGPPGMLSLNNLPPPMHHDHLQHHAPPSPFRGDFTHFNPPQPSPMSPGFPRDIRAGYPQDVFVMDDDYNRTRSASGTPPVSHGPSQLDLHAKSRQLLSMIGRTPSHDNYAAINGSPTRGSFNPHPTMNQSPGMPRYASPNGLAAQHAAPNVPQHMATSHDARMRDGNLESLSQGLRSLLKIQGQ